MEFCFNPKFESARNLAQSPMARRRVALRLIPSDLLFLQLQSLRKRQLAEACCDPGLDQAVRELFDGSTEMMDTSDDCKRSNSSNSSRR